MKLGTDEVHLWRITLDDLGSQAQKLFQKLSMDEKRKAERFHFERDRKRYIIGRGVLREIASGYLGANSGQFQFHTGTYGKPALSGMYSSKTLHFNVAHSGGLALFAFALDREVGVDIEYIRDIPEMEHIVERFFSDAERKVFYRVSENMKKEVFFQMWTRKEAFLKAVGEGLHRSLDTVDVMTVPGKVVDLLKTQGKSTTNGTSSWHLTDLQPYPGFLAAYAVKGPARHRWIHWPVQ